MVQFMGFEPGNFNLWFLALALYSVTLGKPLSLLNFGGGGRRGGENVFVFDTAANSPETEKHKFTQICSVIIRKEILQ